VLGIVTNRYCNTTNDRDPLYDILRWMLLRKILVVRLSKVVRQDLISTTSAL